MTTNKPSLQPGSEAVKKPAQFVNPYMGLANTEYKDWIFYEDQAKLLRGSWGEITKMAGQAAHVEIGTGNGFHFANYAQEYPNIPLLGFEIKYKELVQSIRRSLNQGCKNSWMLKAEAQEFAECFAPGEVEKVMVHFPDPWPKKRHEKHRLMRAEFLETLYESLPPGGVVEFKTDHMGYFKWATKEVAKTSWDLSYYTEDLHNSFVAHKNFVTHFETIFIKKDQSIFYFELRK